jgi:YggT family protein
VLAAGHNPIIALLLFLLDLYWWIIIIAVVVSWLVAFGVLNTYHPTARMIVRALAALTEPVFRPIRRILPELGGLDLSPIIVLVGIWFLEYVLVWLEVKYFAGTMM